MIFGKDPWSQIPESWPQENICIKDEARQHKLSLHWDFCSKCYDALAWAHGGCLLSRLHVFQVVATRDGRLRKHHSPSPVSKPHLSARCLTPSMVRKMCSETARKHVQKTQTRGVRISSPQTSLEKGTHLTLIATAVWRNAENPNRLNPRWGTCMCTKVGSCRSIVIIFFLGHLTWGWWNNCCCLVAS